MRKTLLASALLMATAAAHAAPFSYDQVEGGFGEIDEADALFVKGSKALDKNLYLLGGFYAAEYRNEDGFMLEGGLGYHLPLSKKADLVLNAQLLYADNDADDDLGAILRAGVRFAPVEKFELEGNLAISSNDIIHDDGLGLDAYGRFYFTNQFSGALGLHSDTELDGVSLSVRYNFR